MSNDDPIEPDDLSCREDLSKPEDRANQRLLASCCADDGLRTRLPALFGLPADCALRPLVLKGCRPDLTVLRDGERVAIVECEIGGRDPRQGKDFGRRCPCRCAGSWARIRGRAT